MIRLRTDVRSSSDTIERMTDAIAHRGPDSRGVLVDEESGILLGHTRLAILDRSEAGHQPMPSHSGRFVIVYNGEIYNHLDLRRSLADSGQSTQWRGHSDTETLLACVDAWGVERTLQATVGMFALALWDRQRRELVLARDRFGEKPLYYGWQGATFLFGSDLAALRAHPDFRAEVDRDSLALYLRHNTVPEPYSIFRGIRKLESGTWLTVRLDGDSAHALTPKAYWSLSELIARGRDQPFTGTPGEATDAMEERLSQAVRSQLIADVPLGAFLSGGVDSSLIVALMQKQSSKPVRTFTIGSAMTGYDEADYARAVAQHLGTEHTEVDVSPQDALAVIPDLPAIYSEPFADSSQIPTFLVSRLAREHVTVALSGDGGDEVFGGYNRYLDARRAWEQAHRWPSPARRIAARLLESVAPGRWDAAFEWAGPLLPRRLRVRTPGDKLHKLAMVLRAQDGPAYYRLLTSLWKDPGAVVVGAVEPPTRVTDQEGWPEAESLEAWMMAMDTRTFLSDDILTKVDRAAMANGLEARIPFLDHRVVELAWRLPLAMKIRDGEGKWILRQVLNRYVPIELIDRPKMGFGVPIDVWLRGPLREWAESLIGADRLEAEGYFRPEPIRELWRDHLSGRANRSHELWTILMFQAWLDNPASSPLH